jgi:3-isopropylmalate dehydrogenase
MHKKIAVLPGDGVGPEVVAEAIKVLNAVAKKYDHVFEYKVALIGATAIDKTGTPLPDESLEICRSSDAILFGAIGHPKYDNDPNAKIRPEQGLLKLRKSLDLFANIRPVKSYEILFDASPLKNKILENVDFVVFRELTGGIYFGEKGRKDINSAYDICSYSEHEIKRIAHLAFQAASQRKKKLTLVDKANVLETSRLWREVVSKVANSYVEVELDFLFVDNAAMQLIQNPSRFDVIITENMFGDILTDEASVLSGSMGMLPSASVGGKIALYEPIHGSFPEGAGKNIANPMATILSVAMMLDMSFGLITESFAVYQAVQKALDDQIVTSDINSHKNYSTSEVGTYISVAIDRIQ